MIEKKITSPFKITSIAVFTALVCVATILFSVYVPDTHGFFNVGDSMVFLSALLFGPLVGAFAGGVGSALADILLGYAHYAPATLIVKACEGYVVGFLKQKTPKISSKISWKLFTLILGIIMGTLLATIGTIYYSGNIEITLGIAPFVIYLPSGLPSGFWLILGAIVMGVIAFVGLVTDPEFGWTIFSVICGGLVMVTGYFIYQWLFIGPLFNIQVLAIAEIPVNLGQMIIGATIALPIYKIAKKALLP